MAGTKPNWKAAKAEYLKGDISLNEVADKYGIPIGTLKTRSAKEKWGEAKSRTASKVMSELPGRIADVVANEAVETTRQQLDDLREAGRIARSLLLSVGDVQALKDWAAAYKSIQACQRIALGLEGKGGDAGNGGQPPAPVVDPSQYEGMDPAELSRLYREQAKEAE